MRERERRQVPDKNEIALESQLCMYLSNPAPFVLRKFCWIREGAGLTNLMYCAKVHEKAILVNDSYAGFTEGTGL